jgi:HAD superfamily hydrolase (TIGR01548 family)
MVAEALVFDMDGVLVDVSESYREAIARTVKHFTGLDVSRRQIQNYKNQGGWNNDWALAQKICIDFGEGVAYDKVVDYFQSIFFGPDGLIHRERWIAEPGLLERLAGRYALSIFTGRTHEEADVTLARDAGGIVFDPIIAAEDIEHAKPAPDGLLRIAGLMSGRALRYIGDTVDDARSARAAGVRFIGIAAGNPELASLLQGEGAVAVLETINELETVLE